MSELLVNEDLITPSEIGVFVYCEILVDGLYCAKTSCKLVYCEIYLSVGSFTELPAVLVER